MAFGSKRKLADQSDIEEDDADDVDLINSDDERNSALDASDEQDESAEHEDFSGEEKTGEAIAQFLLQAIEEIGPSNVLQFEDHVYPIVFGKAIVKFFRNHQHFQDLFRRKSKLDLLKVSKTRFASHYIVLKRLMDVREALTTTIVTSKWKELVKACDVQTRAAANAIAQNIIDETFWDEIKIILDITKPLYMVIKFSDGEGPKSGDIYERMDSMLGEMQEVMTREDNPHEDDWSEYYDQAYLASPAPGGGQRKAPNDDSEVMEGVIEALNRIAEDKKRVCSFTRDEELNAYPSLQIPGNGASTEELIIYTCDLHLPLKLRKESADNLLPLRYKQEACLFLLLVQYDLDVPTN
ncbi:hypothetical protein D1007_33208 [Hordeum vulgare]|nr:hypothetical protein D1007_33208 [Hordeum vulgare]